MANKQFLDKDGVDRLAQGLKAKIPTKTSQLTNDSGFKTTDNNTTYSLTQDTTDKHKITLTPSSGSAQTITIPDNNTTYTFATGDANGQIKVTPSGGSAQNVSVKGLGTAAYTASTDYLAANGNANSATKLATARKINGVSFDGSADITVADSTKVAKTGDTMTGNLIISKATPTLSIKSTDNTTAAVINMGHAQYNTNALTAYPSTVNGYNLAIQSGGITAIGSGEAAINLLSAIGTNKDQETLYLLSDNQLHLETNAQTIGNRVGYQIDNSGNIIPEKAEVATNNFGSLGTSSYKLANVYATTIHGALDGNATSATTAIRQSISGIDVQTGDTKQSRITLETLMSWLIATKQYIPSGVNCHVILRPSWSYAANDILQINDGTENYELQLAGCEIDFKGSATSYNTGTFTLRISTATTSSYTLTSGYTNGVNCQFIYRCNGKDYSPGWRRIADHSLVLPKAGGTMTGAIKWNFGGSGTTPAETVLLQCDGSTDGVQLTYGSTTADAGIARLFTVDDANAKLIIGNKISSTQYDAITVVNGMAQLNKMNTLTHTDGSRVTNGSWYQGTTGVAGTATEGDAQYNKGVQGTSVLEIGNNIQYTSATNAAANNSTGYLRLYGPGTNYTQLSFNGTSLNPSTDIQFPNVTSGVTKGIYFSTGDNDGARIIGGATAANAGYLEIATNDDGNEPIYVRQYNGGGGFRGYTTIARTATLLDASGNTSFPGTVTASSFTGSLSGNASTATKATQDSDGHAINSTYLKLSGGTMTGSIKLTSKSSAGEGAEILNSEGAHLVAFLTDGTGSSFGAAGSPTRLRSSGDNLTHLRQDTGNSYKILDAGNYSNYALPLTGGVLTNSLAINACGNQGQYIMRNGTASTTYTSFWRNDGNSTYLLMTNVGDHNGTWNSLRPFIVANSSGAVQMLNGVTASAATIQKTIDIGNNYTYKLSMGGADTYGWIDCREKSSGTVKSNIVLFSDGVVSLDKGILRLGSTANHAKIQYNSTDKCIEFNFS